jgi:hypothetical protein
MTSPLFASVQVTHITLRAALGKLESSAITLCEQD